MIYYTLFNDDVPVFRDPSLLILLYMGGFCLHLCPGYQAQMRCRTHD